MTPKSTLAHLDFLIMLYRGRGFHAIIVIMFLHTALCVFYNLIFLFLSATCPQQQPHIRVMYALEMVFSSIKDSREFGARGGFLPTIECLLLYSFITYFISCSNRIRKAEHPSER